MTERLRVAVLTTGRQDFGVLRSTLVLLRDDPRFELLLWAGGMHLSDRFGRGVDRITAAGFRVDATIDFLVDEPDMAAESARAITSVTAALGASKCDALVLVGDRYETLAAAFAATLARVPIVHLHGGEEAEGAIDNALRHAITKLSHLHLVSHEDHARRVLQMGEPPDAVKVVGAPGLDNAHRADLPDRAELERRVGVSLDAPVVVVTLHPTTLGGAPEVEAREVASAMERVPATYVVTQPNSDAGGATIRELWKQWGEGRSRVAVVEALGEAAYWGLLRTADAVLGNSSSGIIEAPAVGLPVINVGDRQRGRMRSEHVIDVPAEADRVAGALAAAIAPGARERFRAMKQVFPRGPAAPRIVQALAEWHVPRPPRKKFHDLTIVPVRP